MTLLIYHLKPKLLVLSICLKAACLGYFFDSHKCNKHLSPPSKTSDKRIKIRHLLVPTLLYCEWNYLEKSSFIPKGHFIAHTPILHSMTLQQKINSRLNVLTSRRKTFLFTNSLNISGTSKKSKKVEKEKKMDSILLQKMTGLGRQRFNCGSQITCSCAWSSQMSQHFQKPLTRCPQINTEMTRKMTTIPLRNQLGNQKASCHENCSQVIWGVKFRVFCDIVTKKDLFLNK